MNHNCVRWWVRCGEPARAKYAIGALCDAAGLPNREVEAPEDADLCYSNCDRDVVGAGRRIHLLAGASANWTSPPAGDFARPPVCANGTVYPGEGGSDVLQLTFALLTGAMEFEPRNRMGVPFLSRGVLRELGLSVRAPVVEYSRLLHEWLTRDAGWLGPVLPRWPNGKKYAIVLTHDVDCPFVYPRARYQVARLAKVVNARRWRDCLPAAASVFKASWGYVAAGRSLPAHDPNVQFEAWFAIEAMLGSHGTYYVAAGSLLDPWTAPEDVAYDFRDPALSQVLRRGIALGAEVGLHASINARTDRRIMEAERQRLSEHFSVDVVGIRHHYWALDVAASFRTLKSQRQVGFLYDSSLGVNDAPGFRRGTCLPFRPFDLDDDAEVDIWELPPTLMDGGIFLQQTGRPADERSISAHLDLVGAIGGAAVLDWHPEQINPRRLNGAGPALFRALLDRAGDPDVYWCTARDLASWWEARHASLRLGP